ncbi:MAG TPA: serine/threonine-protein kinase, partial [Nannocystis sp.]
MEPRTTRTRRRGVAPIHDPQPGTTLGGRYTIVRLIARGGVGLVYLARRSISNDAVVVKVLAASVVGDSETAARFDREAQRLRGIQHPNIVAMVDYGRTDGSAYLVMEYLEGELLSAYAARRGPLALADFTPIAAQILKAIGYAHEHGLMHRDLKPSNIMLCTRKGRANFVKILDFGMAKLVDDERDITSEQIVGTANYLSPEQIRGEAIDARVDVYAIGVMFYALLSGRLPFTADNNAALLYKHVHEPPPPLGSRLPDGHDIPPQLVALVHRCLAKDVADRPLDANAVAAELVACIPGELFHLPVATSGAATASSSYAVLPASIAAGPDDLSDRLTRPVQSLRAARTGQAATTDDVEAAATAPITGATAATGRARTGNRLPRMRPATLPPSIPIMPIVMTPPPGEGGKLWLVLAGVVVLALLGLGGWLVSHAGRTADASQGP